MPFIVPMVVAALELGAVAAAFLEIGVAVGTAYLATKLAPKPPGAERAPGGSRVGLRIDTNSPRQIIIGETLTGGSLVYWHLYGESNSTLQMVIALADHECNALTGLWVNKKPATLNADGSVEEFKPGGGNAIVKLAGQVLNTIVPASTTSKMHVKFYSGAPGQTADADLIAHSEGRWTENDIGVGMCYAIVNIDYDEKLFPSGIPEIGFIVQGAKLYDARMDTTAGGSGPHRWGQPNTYSYTNNTAVAIYNVLRGISSVGHKLAGLNAPAEAIRFDDFAASANACDELISLKSGSNELRYRCNSVFEVTQNNRSMIETMTATFAGFVIESGGIYRIIAGVAQPTVAELSDADLITKKEFSAEPKRPRNELTNAVLGAFTDPSRGYNSTPLPPRTSSVDEAMDGLRLAQTLDFGAITSRTQAQRCMEIQRRRNRQQLCVQGTFRARWFTLEPGDWVTFSSARRGYISRVFEIENVKVARDLTTSLVLREVDASIDDWEPANEIDDNQSFDQSPSGPTLTQVSGLAVQPILVSSGSAARRPGLSASWSPITDPTCLRVQLEYRRVGDTVALTVDAIDPSTGSHAWVSGVQGDATYEVRALPVSMPQRAASWTPWVASTSTQPQIVNVAALATAVPLNTVTPAMLSAQARFELALSSAVAEIHGSTARDVQTAIDWAQKAAEGAIMGHIQAHRATNGITVEQRLRVAADEVLAEQITTFGANLETTNATLTDEIRTRVTTDQAVSQQITTLSTAMGSANSAIQDERTARSSNDLALGQRITTMNTALGTTRAELQTEQQTRASQTDALTSQQTAMRTTLNGHTTQIGTFQSSINGIAANWGVSINTDGFVTGLVQLGSIAGTTSFDVIANRFRVAQPGVAGGAPVNVFSVGTINGVPSIGITGNLLVDGAINARHLQVTSLSALSADLGTVVAGKMQSADGKFVIDMAAKTIRITT
jgi:hypothetical protein